MINAAKIAAKSSAERNSSPPTSATLIPSAAAAEVIASLPVMPRIRFHHDALHFVAERPTIRYSDSFTNTTPSNTYKVNFPGM